MATNKCRQRAQQAVWWPGLSQLLATGDDTQLSLMLQRMPLTFRAFNEHGTTKLTLEEIKVTTNLFYWKASTYLLIVDYYSRYIEICKYIKC